MINFKHFVLEESKKAKDMKASEIYDLLIQTYPEDSEADLKSKFKDLYSYITNIPNKVITKKSIKDILS